jgi:5-deoxy-glucuronate isomerase
LSNKNWVFHTPKPKEGLYPVVSPQNSDLKHLVYERLWVAENHDYSFAASDNERGLVCLTDEVTIVTEDTKFVLKKNDTLYLPWHTGCVVKNTQHALADIVVFEADAFGNTDPKLIKFAEVKSDPERNQVTGAGTFSREVCTMIDQDKINACRLIVGITCGNQGAWTSWPPHDHTQQLEELYLYHDLPAPGFVIQVCLNSFNEIDLCEVVKEGDAAIMPRGGHPTVAAPNTKSYYLWAMAAHEGKYRRTDIATTMDDFK